jgi:nitroreductase
MELTEAILTRRSIRAFEPRPVPRRVLQEVMEIALWTPSFANTQSWEFCMVGGEKLEELRRKLVDAASSDPEGNPDLPWPTLGEPYTTRRRGVGVKTLAAKGITRDDRDGREAWRLLGAGFFDAPRAIIFYTEREFGPWAIFDAGAISLAVELAAHDRGLGTVPQAAPARYPEVIHQVLGIPQSKIVILGMAIGYPNPDDPVNRFPRERDTMEALVQWQGIPEES